MKLQRAPEDAYGNNLESYPRLCSAPITTAGYCEKTPSTLGSGALIRNIRAK
jgi:hypothetical protein